MHIGDYAEATGHLTLTEDGAYFRMIRKYYALEGPLPTDVKEVQRLMICRTAGDREAVKRVLHEFFELGSDGWHNERCDEVIAAYLEDEPEREERRRGAKERKKRYNERRRELFEQLRQHGKTPGFKTPMEELERMLERVLGNGGNAFQGGTRNALGTREGTATHSPVPISQSPVPSTQEDTHTDLDPQSRARHAAGVNGSDPKPKAKGSVCVEKNVPEGKPRAQH